MRAKTVAQVIAAEAGGKTLGQRLQAMKDVFSAIVNRAEQTGETLESVVEGSNQFSAYNQKMPAGTKGLVALAQQAMREVQQNGPTHKGTYYARSYATKNLPKGLKKIKTAVDDHVYYTDPKNRAIITAKGVKRPTVAEAAPSVGGLLASLFGTSANAAPQGLGAEADYFGSEPTKTWGPQREQAVQDRAIARAKRGFAPTMAANLGKGFMGGLAVAPQAASAAPASSRISAPAPAAMNNGWDAQGRMSMQRPDMGAIEGARDGVMGLGVFSPQVQSVMAQGPAASRPTPESMTRDMVAADPMSRAAPDPIGLGRYSPALSHAIASAEYAPSQESLAAAKAWGTAQGEDIANGRTYADVQADESKTKSIFDAAKEAFSTTATAATPPSTERAYTPPDQPGSVHVGGLQPIGAETAITGTTPDLGLGATLGAGLARGLMSNMTFAPPSDAPTIAAPDEPAEDTQTIAPQAAPKTISAPEDTFPAAPPNPTRMETLNAATAVALDKMGLGFVNKASNAITGGLGSLFSANMPSMSGPNYGSGLGAMQQAMGGAPGGFASSRSNPGYSYGKTATGGVRYGPHGWQTLDEAGETTGALRSYGDNKTKGLGGFFSGLFGGEGKSKSKDKDKDKGGLGHYSGKGLY
jgi:hypothetical protein